MEYTKIKGYKYLTEQEATDVRETIDAYYGIPVSPDDVTQNWIEYNTADLEDPIFWYIIYDDSLLPVLGDPELFNVLIQNKPY